MKQSNIFLSFSHKDAEWAKRLRVHLQVAERKGTVSLWDDRRIKLGAAWAEEIKEALNSASVAVLLVSPDFLASDFISNIEVPALLRRRAEEGLVVLPLLVRHCLWHEVDWLRQMQFWPNDARPLSSFSEYELDRSLLEFVMLIVAALERKSGSEVGQAPDVQVHSKPLKKSRDEKYFFISHAHEDGDFAELLQLRIEKHGYNAWRDIEKLSVGVDWRQEIDQNIRLCSAVIVVMSPSAKKSEYVTYEWAFAWGVGVTVIPIMLKPTPLHPRLETLQFLDFTNKAARPWDKLMAALDDAQPINLA